MAQPPPFCRYYLVDYTNLLATKLGCRDHQKYHQPLNGFSFGSHFIPSSSPPLRPEKQDCRPCLAAYKSPTKVRTRIVAKDLDKGASAGKLGISSPTPRVEGLYFVLALAHVVDGN